MKVWFASTHRRTSANLIHVALIFVHNIFLFVSVSASLHNSAKKRAVAEKL